MPLGYIKELGQGVITCTLKSIEFIILKLIYMSQKNIEIIQISISGGDKVELQHLTDVLAKYDAFILDIGQANIHKSLALEGYSRLLPIKQEI